MDPHPAFKDRTAHWHGRCLVWHRLWTDMTWTRSWQTGHGVFHSLTSLDRNFPVFRSNVAFQPGACLVRVRQRSDRPSHPPDTTLSRSPVCPAPCWDLFLRSPFFPLSALPHLFSASSEAFEGSKGFPPSSWPRGYAQVAPSSWETPAKELKRLTLEGTTLPSLQKFPSQVEDRRV